MMVIWADVVAGVEYMMYNDYLSDAYDDGDDWFDDGAVVRSVWYCC